MRYFEWTKVRICAFNFVVPQVEVLRPLMFLIYIVLYRLVLNQEQVYLRMTVLYMFLWEKSGMAEKLRITYI